MPMRPRANMVMKYVCTYLSLVYGSIREGGGSWAILKGGTVWFVFSMDLSSGVFSLNNL